MNVNESRECIEAISLWLSGPRCPEFRPESVPVPGPGEVRVTALASAISQGTEMLVYRGHVPPGLLFDLPTFSGSFAFPIKYGYALVGRVTGIGAGVSRFSEGDPVFVR